jgi:beta-lactamase superfamily II metal-dependent hydrolase
MARTKTLIVQQDLVKLYPTAKKTKGEKTVAVLAWGDAVRVAGDPDADVIEVQFDGKPAFVRRGKVTDPIFADRKQSAVLKIDMVDVQQGDGAVIETPDGRIVLVDGGDNQLFARYLAARFRRHTADDPKDIDCIIVTHGDADHFEGLARIHESETNATTSKRLFIRPHRVYHNGLVKRPSRMNKKEVPDVKLLGATKEVDGETYITGLEEDLFAVDDAEMNEKFLAWKRALEAWSERGEIEMRRLQIGMHDAFDFLAEEEIRVEVLGPITTPVGGKPALRFLGEPPKGPRIGHESMSVEEEEFGGKSASHTINGHSIIFRLTFGDFSFLFTGDLNDEAGRALAREHNRGTLNLRAEVFKVPHHGSADFSGAFIQAVSPVVSVVSSGDESARKEYIHPRATIMGALGRYSRVEEPLIFVTELVAFFSMVGPVSIESHEEKNGAFVPMKKPPRGPFFAFERTAYGIVKFRTDGKRMLVFTNSGNRDLKEAYAYTMDEWGKPKPSRIRQV